MDEKVLCRTIDCHFGASFLESSGNAMECSCNSALFSAQRGETNKTCSACHAAMNPGQKPEQWPPTANRGEERKNLQNLKAHQVPMCSTISKCFNIQCLTMISRSVFIHPLPVFLRLQVSLLSNSHQETSSNCTQYQANPINETCKDQAHKQNIDEAVTSVIRSHCCTPATCKAQHADKLPNGHISGPSFRRTGNYMDFQEKFY